MSRKPDIEAIESELDLELEDPEAVELLLEAVFIAAVEKIQDRGDRS